MKFYKKIKSTALTATIVILIIVFFMFVVMRNYNKEGLDKAQTFSKLKQDEQTKIDEVAAAKAKSDKTAIKNIGNVPGSAKTIEPTVTSKSKFKTDNMKYDPKKLYADASSYASLNPELRGSEKEKKQTQFEVDLKLLDPYPVYYEPGSFPFSSTGYIPDYEDSVYLSRTTNLSQVGVIENAPYLQGGFCTQFAKDDLARNEKCGTLDSETCASTTCCVLMGGTKCVAGDANGPMLKTVYSDITIPNRDYWYYQGKCSGDCP
jgi:hypothetical protein